MQVHLIWAQAHNRVIGVNGQMPWHLPEDLAHFKRCTLNAPVIMGRKTWESLPERFRPLPKRSNIVVSGQPNYLAACALLADSLENAIALAQTASSPNANPHPDVVWIIGGAQLYATALPLAKRAVVTEIDASFRGDAFAPELSANWRLISTAISPTDWQTSSSGLRYRFLNFERK